MAFGKTSARTRVLETNWTSIIPVWNATSGFPPLLRSANATGAPPTGTCAGKSGERIGLVAKRLLPHRWFEAAAKGSLGVQ